MCEGCPGKEGPVKTLYLFWSLGIGQVAMLQPFMRGREAGHAWVRRAGHSKHDQCPSRNPSTLPSFLLLPSGIDCLFCACPTIIIWHQLP